MRKIGLLGIDIGGTSVKAVVCDENANVIAIAKVDTKDAYKNSSKMMDTGPQRNLDVELLWKIVLQVIVKVIKKMPIDSSIVSIAVSSCGCTTLGLDKNDKQISLCASDESLAKEYQYYSEKYSEEEFFALTGYPLEQEITGIHVSALANSDKNISAIDKIFSIDDVIVYKLTGCFSRNYSTATSNGMWDYRKSDWLDLFISRTGISKKTLGTLCDSGILVGNITKQVAEETGLPTNVKVATGGMDYQCAAFAINSFIKNNVFNITGTVDLLAIYQFDKAESKAEKFRNILDFHVIPNQKSRMTETIGAAQTEWLKNNIVANKNHGFSLLWDEFFKDLDFNYSDNPYSSELFVPKIFGSYIPQINLQATGAYVGLNKETDSSSLLRATLEGMAFQTKSMFEFLLPSNQLKQANQLILVGGGSKSKIWKQIKADILGVGIITPNLEEASAIGAALLGGIGAGIYSNHEEAGNVTQGISTSVVECNRKRTEYYNDIFENIYLPIEQKLNEVNEYMLKINKKYRSYDEIS